MGEGVMNSASHVVYCENCVFWMDVNERSGVCRRHAPKTSETIDEVTHWPVTHREDQCGEGRLAHAEGDRPITCEMCRFWRKPPPGGLKPYSRRDQLSEWWTKAGHCVRMAPRPSASLGYRAFWPVTHMTDGCCDGEART
jgi:hypothetical protein